MKPVTFCKRQIPQDFHEPLTPMQQALKLTELIQLCERHAFVTTSGNGCFFLLHQQYIDESGTRAWANGQLLGATYAEAATTLNRIYGAALDPSRSTQW